MANGLDYLPDVTPLPRLRRAVADAVAAYQIWEQALPVALRGLLPSGVEPEPVWTLSNAKQARVGRVISRLADDHKQVVADLLALVTEGRLMMGQWVDLVVADGATRQVQAMVLTSGRLDLGIDSARRLTALSDDLRVRVTSLEQRLLAGEISEAQARSWAGQAGRGLTRTAAQMGAMADLGDEPVRRIMSAGEQHCGSCPAKARTYASLEECIAECGGWPGDGSDDCHGNCLCSLEPVSRASVYADPGDLLVLRGGRSGIEPFAGAALRMTATPAATGGMEQP